VRRRPDLLANHLRVAEAYVALGDPEPAHPHLCRCRARAGELRADERALLDQLSRDAELGACPDPASGRAPSTSHSAAGSAVNPATIDSTSASEERTPN
jgi:hypothetical protein